MIQTKHNSQLTADILGEEFILRFNQTNIPRENALQITLYLLASVLDINEKNQHEFQKVIDMLLETCFNNITQ